MSLLLSLLIALWQITWLGVFATPALTIPLATIAVVTSFYIKKNKFGWQLAFFLGLIFDLLSSDRFGIFLLIMLVTAILAEVTFNQRSTHTPWASAIVTLITAGLYEIIHFQTTTSLVSSILIGGIVSYWLARAYKPERQHA